MRHSRLAFLFFILLLFASCEKEYFISECEYKMWGYEEVWVDSIVRFENRCPSCERVELYIDGQLHRVLDEELLTESIYQHRVLIYNPSVVGFVYYPEHINTETSEGFYYTCYE